MAQPSPPRQLACRITASSLAALALTADSSAQYKLEVAASGFNDPVDVTTFPGNPRALVVAEREQALVVVDQPMPPGPPGTPPTMRLIMLNLSGKADPGGVDFDGLHSIAFHPEFAAGGDKRQLFVRYTRTVFDQGSAIELRCVIERYPVPAGLPTIDPSTGVVLFDEPLSNASSGDHLGGYLRFDRDPVVAGGDTHYLYTGIGDLSFTGDSCGSCPPTNVDLLAVADDQQLAGKLLRFEVTATQMGPAPYVTIAKGLRNPFGLNVDRGGVLGADRGEVWIFDTGSNRPGEFNRILGRAAAGPCGAAACTDFGWPFWEGVAATQLTSSEAACDPFDVAWMACAPPNPTHPDLSVPTTAGLATVSGVMYRGTVLTGLQGRVVYGIYGRAGGDGIFSYDPTKTLSQQAIVDHTVDLQMDVPGPTQFLQLGFRTIGEVFDTGELLAVRVQGVNRQGRVYYIVED